MLGCKALNSGHNDLIHDIKYDHYGKRMATCSSDQTIIVWELKEKEWNIVSKLQGHRGSVWKVSWAHPKYGQVIASCGFDNAISIWEELTNNQLNSDKSDWVKRFQLVESDNPITDIKFAPSHLGLQLAACSTDGIIRLYEALNLMDLSQWTLQQDFPTEITASCLSWSQSSAYPTLLAVGNCDSDSDCKILLYQFMDVKQNCTIIEKVKGSVHDLAFAPCMGQSFHTLAVAADDLYIFYIKHISDASAMTIEMTGDESNAPRLLVEQAVLETNNQMGKLSPTKMWRVSWNVTGTLLAASGEDGQVRLWKRNYLRVWSQVLSIQPEQDIIRPMAPPVYTHITNTTGSMVGQKKHVLASQTQNVTTPEYEPRLSNQMFAINSNTNNHNSSASNSIFQQKSGVFVNRRR